MRHHVKRFRCQERSGYLRSGKKTIKVGTVCLKHEIFNQITPIPDMPFGGKYGKCESCGYFLRNLYYYRYNPLKSGHTNPTDLLICPNIDCAISVVGRLTTPTDGSKVRVEVLHENPSLRRSEEAHSAP